MLALKEHLQTMVVVAASGKRKQRNTAKSSQDQMRQDEQNLADDLGENFREWVIRCRGKLIKDAHREDALSGSSFSGVRAVQMGLADALYDGTTEETVAQHLKMNEEAIKFNYK